VRRSVFKSAKLTALRVRRRLQLQVYTCISIGHY